MLKRYLLLLLIVLVAGATSGCGFKDIDRRFFVVGIGLDGMEQGDKRFRLTLKLAVPSSQSESGADKSQVITQDADSVTEAVRLIKSRVDKELDFGYAKVIVLGKNIIKHDLRDTMDWLIRRRDIQMIAWMAVGDPSAEAVLKLNTRSERLAGNALMLSFGRTGVESGYIVSQYLFDFYRKMRELGLDPVLPIVQATKSGYSINTAVVFNYHNAQMYLTKDETRIFNVTFGSVSKVEVEAPMGDEHIYASIDKVKTSFKVHTPSGEKPYARLTIHTDGLLEESTVPTSPLKLGEYEQVIRQTGEKRIIELLQKFQKAGLDPLGFGLDYRSHHFQSLEEEWNNWQRIYPQLEFRINYDIKLKSTGVVR
ncbi:Ger(x)C family spore germination protein [Paenibacillus athensensis]|uniref:Uncharacterized protein n=1 Tax=Paenibacillus athensensis TaxID=1967502 RepID=A0A4Y8PT61_9BACL|nr:Ger(x)C family spore germination protein [Paenibacillus athensensis]MCD1257990.1 Ger(x)C family spore germination protein [Paenibacillus athensensis]